MKSTPVFSAGIPPAFVLTPTDPMYYTERLSYELSYNLYNMSLQNFLWQQVEADDLDDIETPLDNWITDYEDWLDSAVASQLEEPPLPVPSPPSLPDLSDGLSVEAIVAFLIKCAIKIFLGWIKKKFEKGTDVSEVADILRQGLLQEGESTSYALLELLAAQPLQIVLSQKGEYQEFLYTSEPEE